MKVKIGKYKNWFGPYQFTNKVFWFLSEEKREKIAEKIPMKPFEWLDKLKGDRKIKVKIHDYDIWSMDNTLAYIILPMLKKLKENKHGDPFVANEDVPVEIRTEDAKLEAAGEDPNWSKRWDYVLDEMIFAFESCNSEWEEKFFTTSDGKPRKVDFEPHIDEDGKKFYTLKSNTIIDSEGLKAYNDRIKKGFELFGKYYRNLWD